MLRVRVRVRVSIRVRVRERVRVKARFRLFYVFFKSCEIMTRVWPTFFMKSLFLIVCDAAMTIFDSEKC
jgi:hypothetical protein